MAINSSSSPTCNFVQDTNKMKTIAAKPYPIWGRRTLQGRNSFQKIQDGVRKRDIESHFKLLVMGVDDYTRESMQKRKITLFKGG